MRKLTTTLCLTIAVLVGCAGKDFAEGEWLGMLNNPDCSVWRPKPLPQPQETAAWTGNCLKGREDGKGTLTWRFKKEHKWIELVLKGEFRDGKLNGQATASGQGHKYVGEFKDSKPHGQGTFTYANGRVEEGIWKDGKFKYARKVTPPVTAGRSSGPSPDPDKIISASSGSGFAVSPNGHVITNNHVING